MLAKGRHRTRPQRGEDHYAAKLSQADARLIRAEYVRGRGRFQRGNALVLAARYGVNRSAISRVVRGDSWA